MLRLLPMLGRELLLLERLLLQLLLLKLLLLLLLQLLLLLMLLGLGDLALGHLEQLEHLGEASEELLYVVSGGVDCRCSGLQAVCEANEGAEEERGVVELGCDLLLALPFEGVGFGGLGFEEDGLVGGVFVEGSLARLGCSLEGRFRVDECLVGLGALLGDPIEVGVGGVDGVGGGFALVPFQLFCGEGGLEAVTLGREDGVVGGLFAKLCIGFELFFKVRDLCLDGVIGLGGS